MRPVLQLSAAYEAEKLVSVEDAFLLIWKGAAELVEPDGARVLRSQYDSFPQPSVIRLVKYIDIRGKQRRSHSKRNRVLGRDGYRCQYCGAKGTNMTLTMDHIFPASRGGQTSPENLVTACFSCNQKKGDRTPEEAGMRLRKNPTSLTYGIDRSIICHIAENRPEWAKFLYIDSKYSEAFEE